MDQAPLLRSHCETAQESANCFFGESSLGMDDKPWIIDDDRYSRLQLIAWWDQEKIRNASVLVVGAGALGNEVIKNLALLGVGRVVIVDFDEIESSNLTRSVLFRETDCGKSKASVAAEAAREIGPDTQFIPIETNIITGIGLGLIREVDVVIGCLDNREARLWVNRLAWKAERPWIDGGIQEINGVAKVFMPPDGACYECAMTENDYRLINLRYSCPLLKQEDIAAGRVPTAPTISSIIAGLQTQEALKLIHRMPVAEGAALVFNGVVNSFYTTRFQYRDDCLSHETYPEPIKSGLTARGTTAEELFRFAQSQRKCIPKAIHLDRDLIVSLHCRPCDRTQEISRSMYAMSLAEAECPECGETMKPKMVHMIEPNTEFAERSLYELGVPEYDIVKLETTGETLFVLLDGDRGAIMSGVAEY